MNELQGHRYSWVADLTEALRSAEPLSEGADVMARALASAIADNPTNRMLLEVTVRARTDDAVRRTIIEQIHAVVRSREDLFTHLADAGLISTGISTSTLAWLLQAPPIGGRLLSSIGLAPSTDAMRTAIERIAERVITAGD